jgi:hypothetical protein
MTLLLDALAIALVVGAAVYLWQSRHRGCAGCTTRSAGAETRIALGDLRGRLRRAAERR